MQTAAAVTRGTTFLLLIALAGKMGIGPLACYLVYTADSRVCSSSGRESVYERLHSPNVGGNEQFQKQISRSRIKSTLAA